MIEGFMNRQKMVIFWVTKDWKEKKEKFILGALPRGEIKKVDKDRYETKYSIIEFKKATLENLKEVNFDKVVATFQDGVELPKDFMDYFRYKTQSKVAKRMADIPMEGDDDQLIMQEENDGSPESE